LGGDVAEEKVTRKLTTILAADVEGYSRLMRADEEATLKSLGEYRDVVDGLIARHDGRVFSTGGDSVLAEFGSAVEAVRCAISCQEEISSRNAEFADDRKLIFRIGVNVGDVMIRDGDLFGDGVNVAARLEGLSEPGGVCISGSVFEQIKHKLSLGFEDMGPQEVKNIAEPVSAYRLVPGQVSVATGATAAAKPSATKRWRMPAIAAAVVVLVAVVGGALWWRPWAPDVEPAAIERMAFPLPDKPSIAVLPFTNMSADPSQEYFADGMTEDLITDLSKLSGLFVIARNSVFTYKGKAVKVRQVAEELGVRYVLEGSVRRAGDQVRINAQLIDATTGGHIWAERYDGSLANVFALQDKVTRRIVLALAVSLTPNEERQQAQSETNNPEAYNAFLQGWEYYRRFTADDFFKAIPYFERAVALDPEFGRAYAALAAIYFGAWQRGYAWTDKVNPGEGGFSSWGQAFEKAKENLELAMKNPAPLAFQVASRIHIEERQFDDAIVVADRAVELDPNDPEGYLARGLALAAAGRAEKAVAAAQQGLRLDPHYPWQNLYVLGVARIELGEFQEALAALERASTWSGAYGGTYAATVVAYAHLDRKEEAQAALQTYTDRWRWPPRVERVMEYWPFWREVDIRRFGGGLIKAGLCCEERLEEYIARVRMGGTME
jgi:TolB-like protein/class 3 adenylate cyclase